MSFVLDSSVALSWCFKDEQTPEITQSLVRAKTNAIFVPALWHIEMANVLGIALRKGRLSEAELVLAMEMFNALELHTEKSRNPISISSMLRLMRAHTLTAYDATYLELAMRLDLPLATLDAEPIAASHRAGVNLFL